MAILFDGTGDYLDCGTSDTLNLTGAMSISFWVKSTTGANDFIFERQLTASPWTGYAVAFVSTKISYFNNGIGSWKSSTAADNDGAWHHIGILCDAGGGLDFYRDGVADGSHAYTAPGSNSGEKMWVAIEDGAGSQDLAGTLEDLAVWDTRLSVAQIQSLAQSKVKRLPLSIASANLQWYLPMDEAAAGVAVPATSNYVKDLSGNGNHGTKGGDPAYAEGTLSYPGWPVYVHAETVGDITVTPSVLALTGAQGTPGVLYDYLLQIGAELTLTGALPAPTPAVTVLASALSATLAANDPTILADKIVAIAAELALTATAETPTLLYDRTLAVAALALTLAQQAPTPLADVVYQAVELALQLTAHGPGPSNSAADYPQLPILLPEGADPPQVVLP